MPANKGPLLIAHNIFYAFEKHCCQQLLHFEGIHVQAALCTWSCTFIDQRYLCFVDLVTGPIEILLKHSTYERRSVSILENLQELAMSNCWIRFPKMEHASRYVWTYVLLHYIVLRCKLSIWNLSNISVQFSNQCRAILLSLTCDFGLLPFSLFLSPSLTFATSFLMETPLTISSQLKSLQDMKSSSPCKDQKGLSTSGASEIRPRTEPNQKGKLFTLSWVFEQMSLWCRFQLRSPLHQWRLQLQ